MKTWTEKNPFLYSVFHEQLTAKFGLPMADAICADKDLICTLVLLEDSYEGMIRTLAKEFALRKLQHDTRKQGQAFADRRTA